MKRIFYTIAFVLDIILLLSIGLQFANRWSERWADWPSRVRPMLYNLLILELVLLIVVVFIVKTSRIGILVKTTTMFVVFVVGLCLGVIFSLYVPTSNKWEAIVTDIGMDEDKFATLAPCEQVKIYVEVASISVNHFSHADLAPYWMRENLKGLPTDTVAVCMAGEFRENTSLVASSKTFNEDAVRKIYVLLYEADRLRVLDQPDFQSALKEAVCIENADPFGDLALYYYSIIHPEPISEIRTRERDEKMRIEICGE